MKTSHYDVLQVSQKASPEIIRAAYLQLKPILSEKAQAGSEDARNQMLFLEEAYLVLSSPEKRSAYDKAFDNAPGEPVKAVSPNHMHQTESVFLSWWGNSKTSRVLIAIALFAVVFAVYQFLGQSGKQKIQVKQVEVQAAKDNGVVNNDAFRAQSERTFVEGVVQNQDKLIDRSYDIASREVERRRTELEYRADAGTQLLEMQRQRQESQIQEQKWRQEQMERGERDRVLQREQAVVRHKLACIRYNDLRLFEEARAFGCY